MAPQAAPPAEARRFGTLGGVLGNLGWLLAGKGVGAVLSLVYLGLAARTLGAYGFGQFTLILSTGQAIAALVGFQTWQIVVRFGAGHRQSADTGRLQRLIGFCIGLDLAAAVTGCAIAAAAVMLLGAHFGWPHALIGNALAFCCVSLLSVRSTAVGVLRLYDRFGAGATADAATPITRFTGCLVAVAIHPTVTTFLIAWAVAEVVTAIAYWILAARIAGAALHLGRLRGVWRAPVETPGLWRFTWSTNLAATLDAAGKQFAVLVVGIATGTVAAGNYRLAYQLSQSLVRVSEMFARASFAEFAQTQAGGRYHQMRRLLIDLTRLAGIAALVGAAALLAGKPVLALIAGRGHEGAYLPLQLLGVAAAIDLAGVAFAPVLIAIGRASLALALRLAATVCLLVLMAALLPGYGANGVAAATLAASVIAAGLFGVATFKAVRQLARD